MKHNWSLINNNSHEMYYFPSEKSLRQYASIMNWNIKRSYTDHDCFYVESCQYVPGYN
jgi:hypothetical protein